MSLLAQAFREKVAKSKDYNMKVEVEANISYSTGFLAYDFRNGMIVHGKDPKGNSAPYYSIGIQDGSLVTIIGRSGCGKTTWATQVAGNIIRPFKTSCIFHDDIEGGITNARKASLIKMIGEDLQSRYIHRNTGITAENLYERLKLIHDLKLENRKEYEYDTGKYDETGKRIYKLEPTVYILDSLAMLMPGKYSEEEEISGQMSATAAAKMNSMLFKRVIPMLKSANIIFLVINHINEDVSINPMQKKKAKVSYLKQGEALPGGNASIYLSNLMIRFDDHGKMSDDEGFGINGSLVDLTLVKSRNNKAGQKCTLVFDQDNGYDAELSLLQLLKDNKRLGGAGRFLYLEGLDTVKFSQKEFKKKLRESPEMQTRLMELSMEILTGFLNSIDLEIQEENNAQSITDMFLNKYVA